MWIYYVLKYLTSYAWLKRGAEIFVSRRWLRRRLSVGERAIKSTPNQCKRAALSLAGCGSARADVNVVKVINELAATTEVGAGEKLLFDRIDSDTSIFMPPQRTTCSNAPCWASLPFICLAANHHRKKQTPRHGRLYIYTWNII